jgi:hypothetical protein
LRDVGYNSTTSALCEHVDNAIQWGASEIRVYFRQTGKPGAYKTDVLVLDNGIGMAPNIVRFATSFGGSMVYDNRSGIGRYGDNCARPAGGKRRAGRHDGHEKTNAQQGSGRSPKGSGKMRVDGCAPPPSEIDDLLRQRHGHYLRPGLLRPALQARSARRVP